MNENLVPRPEKCLTCGYGPVHPRVMKVNRGKQVLTEAHWICPKCTSRFKIGTVSIDSEKAE